MDLDDSEEEQDPSTTNGSTSLKHYTPILRDGESEQTVLSRFGGFRRLTDEDTLEIHPLIEITSEDNFDNLTEYKQVGNPVMVDIPQYLSQTTEPNQYTARISALLDGTTPVEILNDHLETVDVPIVSGTLQDPFEYTELIDRHQALASEFDTTALRVFIPPTSLSRSQLSGLRELKQATPGDTRILLDYVSTGNLHLDSSGRINLQQVAEVFRQFPLTVLDAFNHHEGENYNFGPAIAREIGAIGFGDFANEPRYRDEDIPPLGQHDTRNIYHYDYEDRMLRKFQGNGFNGSDSAYEKMQSWPKWNPDHCEFCTDAHRTTNEDWVTWKRIRMGHYIESVIETESP